MRKEAFKLWLETYGKHGVEPMSKRPIDDALGYLSWTYILDDLL